MQTLDESHLKLKELHGSIAEAQGLVTLAATLFLEVAMATSLHKGLSEGKMQNAKCKVALENVLSMVSCKYEGADEDSLQPQLLQIARDSLKPSEAIEEKDSK